MSIIQIIFLIVLVALIVFDIIKIVGMIRTDYDKYREKYEEKAQSFRFITLMIALVFLLFLWVWGIMCSVAAYWEGLVTAWTPPKETQIVKLSPILDNIYVLKDDTYSYFFADGETRRDNNLSIDYDASKPYAEEYKSREKIYLAIDKNRKWPILTTSTETRYLLHLNNIDQDRKSVV